MWAAGKTRGLVWTAAACITVSLLVMIAVSVAGPSISVPAMRHTPAGGPPWWVSLGLPDDFVLFTLWGTAIVAAVGVAAGLIAVARGARPGRTRGLRGGRQRRCRHSCECCDRHCHLPSQPSLPVHDVLFSQG